MLKNLFTACILGAGALFLAPATQAAPLPVSAIDAPETGLVEVRYHRHRHHRRHYRRHRHHHRHHYHHRHHRHRHHHHVRHHGLRFSSPIRAARWKSPPPRQPVFY